MLAIDTSYTCVFSSALFRHSRGHSNPVRRPATRLPFPRRLLPRKLLDRTCASDNLLPSGQASHHHRIVKSRDDLVVGVCLLAILPARPAVAVRLQLQLPSAEEPLLPAYRYRRRRRGAARSIGIVEFTPTAVYSRDSERTESIARDAAAVRWWWWCSTLPRKP